MVIDSKVLNLQPKILGMVYIVDDDLDDVDFVREALVNHSYKGEVDTSFNGRDLLEKLKERTSNPDVIIMDLNMPVKNGYDTLEEIKSTPALKDIPVIILTSSADKRDEARCFNLGCSYFYNKPFTMQDYLPLVHLVKKFVARTGTNTLI